MTVLRLLTPASLFRLLQAIRVHGTNLLALLEYAATLYPDRIAVTDERETLTYKQLAEAAERLARELRACYGLKSGSKAGVLCRNHAELVITVIAVSRCGADLVLMNAEMSQSQLDDAIERQDFDLLIYDPEAAARVECSAYSKATRVSRSGDLHRSGRSIGDAPVKSSLLQPPAHPVQNLPRTSRGKLVLLTSGTTGKAKEAAHQPSLFAYSPAFATMLTRLKLMNTQTAYIATPLYHGYGIAVLFLFLALGKKIVLRGGFNEAIGCMAIREHQVQVVIAVPLMIDKMLRHNANDLRSLTCIASGGAELNPRLVKETSRLLGAVLYNLYGTSEAGLTLIATPKDLEQAPTTLGKPIFGVRLQVRDALGRKAQPGQIGRLTVKNSGAMHNRRRVWVDTGDIGYMDRSGHFYLCGRSDDLVVSAGENVYPLEVEQVLLTHPRVADGAVIGVRDERFGQRLKAIVRLIEGEELAEEDLLDWLRPRLARYQMPRELTIVNELPYTPLGKLDKKRLKVEESRRIER
ncbi:AMP-binding protein [Gorillibacterium timonense]|uniref:AMP-binding protein n=1 Tax=Gorillibacterium timonense TaxID=1689269 RepID=UPI00071C2BF5|nr:AMP-binding protein [Gorillibacterium timonense]